MIFSYLMARNVICATAAFAASALSLHACAGDYTVVKNSCEPCANNGDISPRVATSGARLKIRWRMGEDGSAERVGWRDAELGADCAWLPAEDGAVRCLPAVDPSAGSVGSYYADAACDSPLVLAPLCGEQEHRFGVKLSTTSCGLFSTIWETGEAVGEPVFIKAGSVCQEEPLPEGYGVFALGRRMDPGEFVLGNVEIDP